MSEKKTNVGYEELLPIITEQLDAGGSVCIKPYGTSMLPLIRQGKDSVVLEKHTKKADKYDILFYRRKDGQFVLHRVIKTKKDGSYVIRGDHQFEYEFGINDEDVIGVVKEIRRGGKIIKKGTMEFCKWAIWDSFVYRCRSRWHRLKKIIQK